MGLETLTIEAPDDKHPVEETALAVPSDEIRREDEAIVAERVDPAKVTVFDSDGSKVEPERGKDKEIEEIRQQLQKGDEWMQEQGEPMKLSKEALARKVEEGQAQLVSAQKELAVTEKALQAIPRWNVLARRQAAERVKSAKTRIAIAENNLKKDEEGLMEKSFDSAKPA